MNEEISIPAESLRNTILNCGRRTVVCFVATLVFICALGWIIDNSPVIFSGLLWIAETLVRLASTLVRLASYDGKSFWFPAIGAMLPIYAFAWGLCVCCNTTSETIPGRVYILGSLLCLLSWLVFFCAATNVFETIAQPSSYDNVAMWVIRLPLIIVPLFWLCFLYLSFTQKIVDG
jgi:hypothetical protein